MVRRADPNPDVHELIVANNGGKLPPRPPPKPYKWQPEGKGEALFYVQDARSYVGNSVLWWAKNRCGYTCSLKEAHVFTRAEAEQLDSPEGSDRKERAWPKDVIDAVAVRHVDAQQLPVRVSVLPADWKKNAPGAEGHRERSEEAGSNQAAPSVTDCQAAQSGTSTDRF